MIGFPSHNERAWTWWQPLLPLLLLLLLAGCASRGPQTLPGQIIGEWKTDAARYNGRFLRLETDRITFGLGGVAPDRSEHIEGVSMAPAGNPTDYVIRWRAADGTTDSIVLQFTPENSGELRMKNQSNVVWRRKSEPIRTPPGDAPQRVILRSDGTVEHRTMYRIDCLRPGVCRSY
jgi:hypothetical protein